MLPRLIGPLLALSATAVGAQVEIVLDTSAEAMRNIGGRPLNVHVQAALLTAVEEAIAREPTLQIGLRTAGGSGEADPDSCSAMTLAAPIGEVALDHWATIVEGLSFGGPRPLNAATIAAITDLGASAEPARVVIVTTGPDGCGSDPSEVGAALSAAGGAITLRVVGVLLDGERKAAFGSTPVENATDPAALTAAIGRAILGDADPTPTPDDDASEPAVELDAPKTVPAGELFELSWSGPGADEDHLSLAAAGSPDNDYLHWARTEDGNPIAFRAPLRPGEYELRYVDGLTGEVLARRPLTVEAVPVELHAPRTAVAGRRFEVEWNAAAAEGDFIAVFKPGAANNRFLDWSSTATGSPITLAAPTTPGRYEIRYLGARGREVLAATDIEVLP